jgi:hypothetical protein
MLLLVPCRPGTPTYKRQVKTSCRACIHTLSRALQFRTSPPSWGGLRRCHVSYGSGRRLSVEVGSDAVTCLMAWLRWAPVLPRVIWLRTSSPDWGGLRRCHVSYDSETRLPAEVGSGAATCPVAPDLTSRLGRAPALPRVPRLLMGHRFQA